jgi:DNA-binding NarL/FixJ family response regulator
MTPPGRRVRGHSNEVDEIAVERALAGDGITYQQHSPAERDLVVQRLTHRGRSIRDIATQLATSKRTISRHRHPSAATETRQ